jgi:hypothetical protein
MRIVLTALVIAASPSLALAQSWTATTGTTTQRRAQDQDPARGPFRPERPALWEGAAEGPIEVKRNK